MEPKTSRQEEERAFLRGTYDGAVSDLFSALDSEPKAAYLNDDRDILLALHYHVDSVFFGSKACLLRPLSQEEFK